MANLKKWRCTMAEKANPKAFPVRRLSTGQYMWNRHAFLLQSSGLLIGRVGYPIGNYGGNFGSGGEGSFARIVLMSLLL